jgi:hypothetical protein
MIRTSPRAEWFHENDAHLGVMNTLSATIANLERQHPGSIPNLRDLPTLLVGSDYGGFHQGAAFEVTSFVITNLESLSLWDQNRMHLRKRYLPEGRRMSYKALNDGRRRAALLPFLEAANQIPGLLLSIAIDKNLPTIFCSELAHSHPLLDGWKPAPIERAMRTMHFASLLLRGRVPPGRTCGGSPTKTKLLQTSSGSGRSSP